jgi:hypothetical protein
MSLIHLYHRSVPDTSTRKGARWLLLIHQLPKDPAYLRVKVGRRLARIGAIALKNSVYVLPRSEGALEDFQWVRGEIVEGGGEATLAEAALVDGLSDDEVEARFRAASDAEYDALAKEIRELAAPLARRRQRVLSADERTELLGAVTRLERRSAEIALTDFFGASQREAVSGLIQGLRARAEPARTEPKTPAARPGSIRGSTWVTRTGIHVDRIASAWLIRRSIDPEATFKYVPPKGYVPLEGELRFDMFDAEYSHEGDRCTFETLLRRFALDEPGLAAVAEVIHDIDLKEAKFDRPETAGVAACVAGLCRAHRDDDVRLRLGSELFESLLAHYATRRDVVN